MDVAELGFQIDSSQAASAADNLDKMSASSDRAQSATAKLQASVDAMGASARAYTAFGREVEQFLQSEAKTLDDVADRRYAYNQALKDGIISQNNYYTATK